jgi:hypothetical protein
MKTFEWSMATIKPQVLGFILIFIPAFLSGQTTTADLTGKWERTVQGITMSIVFDETGGYQVEFTGDGITDVTGTCTLEKDRITFQDTSGMAAPEPGIYSFKILDGKITFTIVDDPSQGRSALLPGTWSLKKP